MEIMERESRERLPLAGIVGVVIPTLGNRPDYLAESLRSVIDARIRHIVIVSPEPPVLPKDLLSQGVKFVDDPQQGLAAAINRGIAQLPDEVDVVTWLGDDDCLIGENHAAAVEALRHSGRSAVFGSCEYVDGFGRKLFLSRSGRWAVPLMRIGPQLVPQPGSLVERHSYNEVGGLDESLNWAFDLDLFIKLGKSSRGLHYVPIALAKFRWHEGSLSVGGRKGSVREASAVRRFHLPKVARSLSFFWEPVAIRAILIAGKVVSRTKA